MRLKNEQLLGPRMGRDLERVMPTRDPLATAILMLLIGIVMIVLRSGAVSVLVVFAGVMLMVYGSSAASRGIRSKDGGADLAVGLLAAIVGLLLVIATGQMTSILIILVGVFLIVLGAMAIVSNLDAGERRKRTAIVVGALMAVIGLILILYPGATTDTMMLVIGIVMVLLSAFSLYSYLR